VRGREGGIVTAALSTSPLVTVGLDDRWLTVRLGAPHVVLSWAIVGGGLGRADTIAWREVTETDLRPPVDARSWLRDRMEAAGYGGAVGLLTSRRLLTYVDIEASWGGVSARCIATVGLGNALGVGDPPGPLARIGTINVLARVSVPLAPAALIEAVAIAAEAKTTAVLASGARSTLTGEPATGTGTDCIVVAAPDATDQEPYAGKHTVVGHLIGRTVRDAVARGAEAWLAERGNGGR
jgi:adenosylcobinamide amidohydrolase